MGEALGAYLSTADPLALGGATVPGSRQSSGEPSPIQQTSLTTTPSLLPCQEFPHIELLPFFLVRDAIHVEFHHALGSEELHDLRVASPIAPEGHLGPGVIGETALGETALGEPALGEPALAEAQHSEASGWRRGCR